MVQNHILEISIALSMVLFAALVFILFSQSVQIKQLTIRNEQLQEIAFIDPLTGISNRRFFEVEAKHMLHLLPALSQSGEEYNARRESLSAVSAILVDADHFKQINDSLGHAAGDVVLAALGRCIRSVIRESDLVCRWGGEEIVLLLPDTAADALLVAEKIRSAVAKLNFGIEGLDEVTVSLGVCSVSHQVPLHQLIVCADKAMYVAKKDGRNCVRMGSFIE